MKPLTSADSDTGKDMMNLLQRKDAIIALYREMPGAPTPPRVDGDIMWGDVEGNDHWRFCEAVVDLICSSSR
jgi:hypothetical protein